MEQHQDDVIARLRSELEALQLRYDALAESSAERIQKLEDENEVLAEANRLLLEDEETFRRWNGVASEKAAASTASLLQIPDELLVPGAGFTTRELQTVSETHTFGNLLSVAVHAVRDGVVLTGGADKVICAHDWHQQLKLCEFAASAPVLDLAFNPIHAHADVFVATFMDGKHSLLRLVVTDNGDDDSSTKSWVIEEISSFHEHTRPGAMKVAWSPSGELFATGASDKAVHVFQCAHLAQHDAASCAKVKSFYFNGTVEAVTFVPATVLVRPDELLERPARPELLAIAVRDDCYVHYVDCETFEKERCVRLLT